MYRRGTFSRTLPSRGNHAYGSRIMAERWVTVGILQLRGHPAVMVGDCDYLEEPAWPTPGGQLATLSRSVRELELARGRVRESYIKWAETRLLSILEALARSGSLGSLPDILVFPECSVPGELLPALRSRTKTSGTVVCAGTHTPTKKASCSRPISEQA